MGSINDQLHDIPGQSEDRLQQICVIWFNNHFPQHRGLLFSVPNGGTRNKREAYKFKMTGLFPGVSDLLFMYQGKTYCIELKTETGRQSENQVYWQKKVENQGFEYLVFRSIIEFKEFINGIFRR